MADPANVPPPKPVTQSKIPGTDVPDVSKADDGEERKRWMARVAVSTAVMAAMAAISSSFSNANLNKAMFEKIAEADQWSYYQAKSIKHDVLEGTLRTAALLKQEIPADDTNRLAKYEKEKDEIQVEARKHQKLNETYLGKHQTMGMAATALQIGIGLAAVALLLKKNVYWALALAGGAVGAGLLFWGFLG